MSEKKYHDDCWVSDKGICAENDPENCHSAMVYSKRKAEIETGQWSALVKRRDPGGWRHYLEGDPVNCGRGLELQTIEHKADDYGEYEVPKQIGVGVRYEANLQGEKPYFTLHADVAGYEFVTRGHDHMRFRWPKRR